MPPLLKLFQTTADAIHLHVPLVLQCIAEVASRLISTTASHQRLNNLEMRRHQISNDVSKQVLTLRLL